MSDKSEKAPLPPGWDMKFDSRTGKYYYINHYTKTTSWEDPRERYKEIGKPTGKDNKENEVVPLPNLQVASMRRELEAEQPGMRSGAGEKSGQGRGMNHGATSPSTGRVITPQMGTGSHAPMHLSPGPLARLQLDTLQPYESPLSVRSHLAMRRDSHIIAEICELEASFTTQEQAVAKIASMFPTVEESHIRDLYKKYHGSQAVVMSALQVAKHPLSTPGPAGVYTPPPSRHATLPGAAQGVLAGITMTGSLPYNFPANMTPNMGARDISSLDQSSGYPTPRPGTAASDLDTSYYMGSPQTGNMYRSFPKPHSSPKMKLRYLKSVFPTVEEYLLLDVLANSDNNVQKAADKLSKMGYVKRDAPSAPRLHAKKREEERLAEKRTPLPKPPPIKTEKEKEELRARMKEKYEKKFDIPERILFMALESVLYDEEQANNLITTMIEDDLKRQKAKEAEKMRERVEKKKSPKPVRKLAEPERVKHTSPKHVAKKILTPGKKGFSKASKPQELEPPPLKCSEQQRTSLAKGPNPALCKGPNDDLLLTDYVTWNGPNPNLRKGTNASLAKGPCSSLAQGPRGLANGPNRANAKGPQGLAKGPSCLAKGSMYGDGAATRAN